jgi:hypothetical protein
LPRRRSRRDSLNAEHTRNTPRSRAPLLVDQQRIVDARLVPPDFDVLFEADLDAS